MANTIELAQKFLPVLDQIYKESAVTSMLDAPTQVNFEGTNEVKVLKTSTTGLGNYSRTDGYPKGDITANWETMKLLIERGKEISLDRMDNEETLGMTWGAVTGSYMRDYVVPEVDAYRFAKYAGTSNILTTVGATLTKDTVIAAIDEAVKQMDANEVPRANRYLFISTDLQPVLNSALNRQWGSDGTVNTVLNGYNDMPIKWVVPNRFYTAVTLNDGTTESGYKVTAETGKAINFMIIHKPAVIQATKLVLPKIFTPDENQEKDMWKFQLRMYHDAFVYDNKAKGIYLHKKA